MTILITDDDSEDREILRTAITEIDPQIRIIEVGDGNHAMKWLAKKKASLPDLILMDINMPLKDGFQTLREIKKDDALRDIPVVMYSTSSSAKDMTNSTALGAKHFLVKPDNFEQLLVILQPVIDSHR
jgi:CheY-like chemotaxis protein